MKVLAAVALSMFSTVTFGACIAIFPCKTGSPPPTECRMKVGAVTSTVPPHKGPTSGKYWCAVDVPSGTATTVESTPANAMGAGSLVSLAVGANDCLVPSLDAGSLVPVLPQ